MPHGLRHALITAWRQAQHADRPAGKPAPAQRSGCCRLRAVAARCKSSTLLNLHSLWV